MKQLIKNIIEEQTNKPFAKEIKDRITKQMLGKTFRLIYRLSDKGTWMYLFKPVRLFLGGGKIKIQAYLTLELNNQDINTFYSSAQDDETKEILKKMLEHASVSVLDVIRNQISAYGVDPKVVSLEYQKRSKF